MLLAEYEIKSVQQSRQRDVLEVKAVLVNTAPGVGSDDEAVFHVDGTYGAKLPIGATIEVAVREKSKEPA